MDLEKDVLNLKMNPQILQKKMLYVTQLKELNNILICIFYSSCFLFLSKERKSSKLISLQSIIEKGYI
jgi:hypothetical protein